MSATFIMALDNLLLSQNSITGIAQIKDFRQIQLSDFLLFIVFLMLFVRFFLGDLRYLDSRYIELEIEDYNPKRHTPIHRIIDFTSLLIHGVFFYFLSATILNFPLYYKIFTGVLFFNSIWLFITYHTIQEEDRDITEIKNCKTWAINNIIFVCLLVVFLLYSENLSLAYSLYVFFALATLNSIIDFLCTWDTYFLEIDDKSDKKKEK